MADISFKAKLVKIDTTALVVFPKDESTKLPSRGMTLVEGAINGAPFRTPLEPDGNGSHWLKVSSTLQKDAKAEVGDMVELSVSPAKDWPEPTLPADLQKALDADPEAHELWTKITPMARWDWIRWVGATANPETRKHHVEVTISKLKKGMRRPCCFNRSLCCDPDVAKSGFLREPTKQ